MLDEKDAPPPQQVWIAQGTRHCAWAVLAFCLGLGRPCCCTYINGCACVFVHLQVPSGFVHCGDMYLHKWVHLCVCALASALWVCALW